MDYHSPSALIALLQAASDSSTTTGVGVDISVWDGVLKVIADVNAISGTTPTCDIKIQDSADSTTGSDGTWADVTGATFTQVTTTDTLASIGLNTQACRKWVRAVATLAGTSPVYIISCTAVGQKVVF